MKPFQESPLGELIKINPNKRFGRPCIRDTKISVYDVLAWLAKGMSKEEIIEDFPELTEAAVARKISKPAGLMPLNGSII